MATTTTTTLPAVASSTCQVCQLVAARYRCPRCGLAYCGTDCYRAPKHEDCSEAFYKAQVEQALRDQHADSAEKRRMLEILQRHYNDFATGYDEADDSQDDEEADGDSEEDLAQRLQDLDLDTLAGLAEAYKRMTPAERQAAAEQLASAPATLPLWQPWWLCPVEPQRLGDDDDHDRGSSRGNSNNNTTTTVTVASRLAKKLWVGNERRDADQAASSASLAVRLPLLPRVRLVQDPEAEGRDQESRRQCWRSIGPLPVLHQHLASAVEAASFTAVRHLLPAGKMPAPGLLSHVLHVLLAYTYIIRLHDGDVQHRYIAVANTFMDVCGPVCVGKQACDSPAAACALYWAAVRDSPALATSDSQQLQALDDAAALCQHCDLVLAALVDGLFLFRQALSVCKSASASPAAATKSQIEVQLPAATAANLVRADNGLESDAQLVNLALLPEHQRYTHDEGKQLRRLLQPVERKLYFLCCWWLEQSSAPVPQKIDDHNGSKPLHVDLQLPLVAEVLRQQRQAYERDLSQEGKPVLLGRKLVREL